ILDQQKAVGAVLGIDLGGAEAVRAQDAGDRDIRPDILLGRRRIHQHGAPLAIEEPVIAAEGGIARKYLWRVLAPALCDEKGGHRAPALFLAFVPMIVVV